MTAIGVPALPAGAALERSDPFPFRRLADAHPSHAAALREWRSRTHASVERLPTSVLLLLAERHAAALTVVDTVLADLAGRPSLGLAFYLGLRSELTFGTGDWGEASSSARAALRLAEAEGSPAMVAFAAACLARVEAGRGDEKACRAYVDLARATAPVDEGEIAMHAVEALALLLLGSGRPTDAVAVGSESGRQPSFRLTAEVVVEALVRAGQREAAARTIEGIAVDAERMGHAWARAAVRRCRGLVAPDHLAEAHFREALELHRAAGTPFEAARTELCLGEWLRRNRRPRDAAEVLRRALATFQRLGAVTWAERTRSELRASGDHRRGERRARTLCGGPDAALTPQEERVALAVAEGASNKEAAAALFVSARTVEFHLSSVYRKLGVSSRSQLARQFAQAS